MHCMLATPQQPPPHTTTSHHHQPTTAATATLHTRQAHTTISAPLPRSVFRRGRYSFRCFSMATTKITVSATVALGLGGSCHALVLREAVPSEVLIS
eukprot:COSAG01_NODE_2127_length_8365_cov_5.420276_2_plen_97_part_00